MSRQGTTLEKEKKRYQKQVVEDRTRQMFVIVDNEKPVGDVGLADIDLIDKNAWLVIMIGEDGYRGKGIGTKAIQFIIDYAFNKLKLHKISLQVNENNIPAIKCYQKLGFIEEGRLKEHAYIDNRFSDEIIMSLINKQ